MISDPGVGMLIYAKKVFPFYTCRKVGLHCLKTDHMAYKPSSKYVVGTSSMWHPVRGSNGSNSGNFFSVDEGRERIQIPFFQWAIIGPPGKRHLNGVMSFHWRVDHVIVSAFIWR